MVFTIQFTGARKRERAAPSQRAHGISVSIFRVHKGGGGGGVNGTSSSLHFMGQSHLKQFFLIPDGEQHTWLYSDPHKAPVFIT